MAIVTVDSSLIYIKDESGEYRVTLPINTLNEVYYDMNNRMTLENYLDNLHYDTLLIKDNWVEAIGANYPESLRPDNPSASVHPYWTEGDHVGYMYLLEVPKIFEGETDYDVNFLNADGLKLASDIEIIPHHKIMNYDDKVYIVLYSTRKPSDNIYVSVKYITITVQKKPQ